MRTIESSIAALRREGAGIKGPSTSNQPSPNPMGEDAYHGTIGELVRLIEPHTEAANEQVLVQALVAIGNIMGRGPGFTVESTHHGVNLAVALVGESSKARKGSSWSHVEAVCKVVDPDWTENNLAPGGLSSGEGLIWRIRDAIETRRKARKNESDEADPDGYITEVTDLGVEDKRLLVQEAEFASVIKRMERDGNTLSAIVRESWDGRTLQVMNKNASVKATRPHVSYSLHITNEELRRTLKDTELFNGFANRILFVVAERSKRLPFGGEFHKEDIGPLVAEIKEAVQFAQKFQPEMELVGEARNLWIERYADLSEGVSGLVGAATARAEAQVMRLACLYALLDRVVNIEIQHLRAALAVWEFCESSARCVFGDGTGSSHADKVLVAGRQAGRLSRTQVRDLLGRNVQAHEIDSVFLLLEETGRAHVKKDPKDGPGRPTEWLVFDSGNHSNGKAA